MSNHSHVNTSTLCFEVHWSHWRNDVPQKKVSKVSNYWSFCLLVSINQRKSLITFPFTSPWIRIPEKLWLFDCDQKRLGCLYSWCYWKLYACPENQEARMDPVVLLVSKFNAIVCQYQLTKVRVKKTNLNLNFSIIETKRSNLIILFI